MSSFPDPTSLKRILAAATLLGLSLLACRPVMTVGWEEILILVVLFLFLFGPPLFRFYNWLHRNKPNRKSKEDSKK